MSNMEAVGGYVEIQKYARLYGKFNSLAHKASSLYIVLGPKQSGKSVTIDLMTGKNIEGVVEEEEKKRVADQKNFMCDYDPIYIQQFNNKSESTVFLQGFCLDADKEKLTMNHIKYQFMTKGLKEINNLSIIIAINNTEDVQKHGTAFLIEHMLQCLNLLGEDVLQLVKQLSKHIHILLTKTEENQDEAYEDYKSYFLDLAEEAENQGVKYIMKDLYGEDRIRVFANAEPKKGLGKDLREKFKAVPIDRRIGEYFQKIGNREKVLNDMEQGMAFQTGNKAIRIGSALFNYLGGNVKDSKPYEHEMVSLFKEKGELSELAVKQMGTNFNLQIINEIIGSSSISQNKNKRASFYSIMDVYTRIMVECENKAVKKDGFYLLRGTLQFIRCISVEISDQICNKNIDNMVSSSRDTLKWLSQAGANKVGNTTGNVVAKKATQKKLVSKKQTPFSTFRADVQNLQNNSEAIDFCLNKIKQKQTAQNFDYGDIIFYLKLVRDLLREYDYSPKVEGCFFIEELLQLYAYNENFYQLDSLLNMYLRKRAIPLSSIPQLIERLDNIRHYDFQIKLINYAIANSFQQNQFKLLSKMKSIVLSKQNDEYLNRMKTESQDANKRRYELKMSLQDIKNKLGSSGDEWLGSQSFKRIISNGEE